MLNFNSVYIVQLLVIIFVHTCESKYGEPCQSYPFPCGLSEDCINEICECSSISLLKYDSEAVGTCYLPPLDINCTTCKRGQSCNKYFRCTCTNSSEVLMADECRTVEYQDFMGKCGLVNNKAHFCNTEKNTFCRNRLCLCSTDYFYNQTSKSCVLKKNYTTYHNISEYKALPEGYCLNADDCVEGLRCLPSFKCACPSECKYKKEHLICDCGKVSFKFPMDATLTGLLLGLLSIFLWSYLIHRIVRKEKKSSDDINLSYVAGTPPILDCNEPSYKSDPIPTTAPPPYTIHPESNNASAPPLGFDNRVVPAKSDYNNPPPYASN